VNDAIASTDRWLSGRSIALSISDPSDLGKRGLSLRHLNDAFNEIALQLLALGAQLVYGGDLRTGGYTELLFELVARYSKRGDNAGGHPAVINVLPYPVHITLPAQSVQELESRFAEIGKVVYLGRHGEHLSRETRLALLPDEVAARDWDNYLTSMRVLVTQMSNARIVLGGRHKGYLGRMPGIMEEAIISNYSGKPLYLIGGFGGVAYDLAAYSILDVDFEAPGSPEHFHFTINNGLTHDEQARLSTSPHIDEIAMLIIRGLRRLFVGGQ
jgi:hypothetical protein